MVNIILFNINNFLDYLEWKKGVNEFFVWENFFEKVYKEIDFFWFCFIVFELFWVYFEWI